MKAPGGRSKARRRCASIFRPAGPRRQRGTRARTRRRPPPTEEAAAIPVRTFRGKDLGRSLRGRLLAGARGTEGPQAQSVGGARPTPGHDLTSRRGNTTPHFRRFGDPGAPGPRGLGPHVVANKAAGAALHGGRAGQRERRETPIRRSSSTRAGRRRPEKAGRAARAPPGPGGLQAPRPEASPDKTLQSYGAGRTTRFGKVEKRAQCSPHSTQGGARQAVSKARMEKVYDTGFSLEQPQRRHRYRKSGRFSDAKSVWLPKAAWEKKIGVQRGQEPRIAGRKPNIIRAQQQLRQGRRKSSKKTPRSTGWQKTVQKPLRKL